MPYNFQQLGGPGLDEGFAEWLIENCRPERVRRFGRLQDYYSNPASEPRSSSLFNERSSCLIQAQEQGLPARITGVSSVGIEAGSRKEVVIENDIGWRIDSMNDFLFGRGVRFVSRCADAGKAREIERIINEVFEANGEGALLMSLGMLGAVQGFADIIVRTEDLFRNAKSKHAHRLITLDLTSAQNCLPLPGENDCRKLDYYIQHFPMQVNRCEKSSALSRLAGRKAGRKSIMVTEVFGALAIQRYHDGELISGLPNRLGEVPVVHIQNITRPHSYEGASEVEPLIPLQDELNTRLSDRAARITMQSFKLYLAKGIENPGDCELKPGRVWFTWNDEAKIEEFGGDSACPGEESHIAEIREAMDKLSGVTPLAAGVIRSKIGNLTSAVALKMTLMGMLSKNERRRQSYGAGLRQVCRLILKACNLAGIIELGEEDYAVETVFADPLPENTTEKLNEALLKKEVGLPEEEVFRELGVRY